MRALLGASAWSLGQRVLSRRVANVGRRAFEAEVCFTALAPEIQMATPLSIDALPEGQGCGFYSAAFSELLRCLTGFEGALVHDSCLGRGADACAWHGAATEDYA